jgi:RimJ/RimL family protein N-acetyltransferase
VDFSPLPKRLETERLLLTPEVEQDADWLADLLTARGHGLVSVQDAAHRIAAMTATIQNLGIGALVLRVKPTLDPIGYCAVIVGRTTLEEPELAFELLPRAHGNGYATEAAEVMLAAAFATGRTRIWSTVRDWNTPSLRVLDKVGFQQHHSTVDSEGSVLWMVREK